MWMLIQVSQLLNSLYKNHIVFFYVMMRGWVRCMYVGKLARTNNDDDDCARVVHRYMYKKIHLRKIQIISYACGCRSSSNSTHQYSTM